MRFKQPTGIDADAVGLIFFAQCLDELLYEYTPATYKPRVMSPSSLGAEALSIIEHIEAGSMDRNRLTPVLEELASIIKSDNVAKRLLPFESEFYLSFSAEEKLVDVRLRLSLLINVLKGSRYTTELQHQIIKLCSSDKQKMHIRTSAKSWVSAMLSLGYSKQHIATQTSVFYDGTAGLSDPAHLATFFRSFDMRSHKYDVLFVAPKIIKETESSARYFRIYLPDNEDDRVKIAHDEEFRAKDDELLVAVCDVTAKDPYTAKNDAEKRLERLSDMFALFHHKRKIHWQSNALSIDGNALAVRVNAATSGAKRSRDSLPTRASQKLAEAMNGLSFADRQSFDRFISVVRLHGSAQEATSSEAQLINLWTGMEVLVPRASGSKLREVLRLIMPFLNHGYFNRLLFALAGDLYRWNRKGTSKLLKRVQQPDWKPHQKLALALLGGDYEEVRSDLYKMTEGYALLMNRCFEMSKLISKKDHLNERITEHERRITWQIERIYRARNSIIHDGKSPSQTDALVENAHEYLDGFIDRFIDLCARHKYAKTLDEAIEFQSRYHLAWRKQLRAHGEVTPTDLLEVCGLDAP